MLTSQWNQYNYRDPNRQRLYLKDIDCPPLWHDKLKEQIPPGLFYLNDSIGDIGGLGAVEEPAPNGVGTRPGRGIARAGDLMSCVPSTMRADNLMCYIGHEGTYTPAHREMCASLGQNIMVEASGLVGADGKPTRPGSSIWFMTESKDRFLVSEYWLSTLGHDIEVEAHFAQINAWKRAPFTVYIVKQQVGDFIIIPPLAPHQVWNRGTRTMKVAWNRTTVETLELALNEALPRARMVCRDEQYKNKAMVLFALNRYSRLLRRVDLLKSHGLSKNAKVRQLEKDFKRLFSLFTKILLSETFPLSGQEKIREYLPYDSNVTCSYCRCNIFNRFLTCKNCLVPLENEEEDTYDVCMECYAMGRSCRCRSKLTWAEQFPWKDLLEKYEEWRHQVIASDGKDLPLTLYEERERLRHKSLAQICQEQLKIRPWRDPAKEDTPENLDSELESDDLMPDGSIKKRKKRRSEKWYRDNVPCHICSRREAKWKLATCSCGTSFCYGSLWRGFDMMPQSIMEDLYWKCPKCRKICTCSTCSKDPKNKPYEPKGTVLGHDTRKVADPRSVESLVDFSASNMHWVKKAGDETRPLLRVQDEAEKQKSTGPTLNEHYVDEDTELCSRQPRAHESGIPIDPQLGASDSSSDHPGAKSHTREAALAALSVMDGMSRLEQDPAAFMMQAGLANGSGSISNGITYEYPEPEGLIQPTATSSNGQTDPPGNKRKRKRELPKVRSDANAPQDANQKFQKTQTQRTMAEAKRKGFLIRAQAALTGHSLVVRLPINPSKMSAFNFPSSNEPFSLPVEDPEASVVVESDLPKNIPDAVANARNPIVPKKRARKELDTDFRVRKRGDRQPAKPPLETIDQEADPSDVDSDDVVALDPKSSPTVPKSRSLPAYLARRSPVDGMDMPKELSNETPRRNPKQVRTSSSRQTKAPSVSRPISASSSEEAAVSGESEVVLPTESSDVSFFGETATKAKPTTMVTENLRAKRRAMGEALDSDSEFSSDDSLIATVLPKSKVSEPPTPQKKRGRGRPPGSSTKKKQAAAALKAEAEAEAEAPSPAKRSIFSRRGRGNIRITSSLGRSSY